MNFDVFDNCIWIEPLGGESLFINYDQETNGPVVQIFGIFNSDILVGLCVIPNDFSQSSQNSIVAFSVDRNTSVSSSKIQSLKIMQNSEKAIEGFLGDGSDNFNVDVIGPVLISVEGSPWDDVEEVLTESNTFKIQTEDESIDSDYLQVTLKHGFYYLLGNSDEDFFDREIAFVLHEEYIHSFFQSTSFLVQYQQVT
jgi:hypothetical protein